MLSSSSILFLFHVGSFCPFLWVFLYPVWVLLLPFVGCLWRFSWVIRHLCGSSPFVCWYPWWFFSRSMWLSCSRRVLQQSRRFGRQWGFLPVRDFLGYPLEDLGINLSNPFEEPLQNQMAFVFHGTDSSYCLLGWDLVSIPTIELLKLLSCYLYDDLLDLCFVLLLVVVCLLYICCWFLCLYIWLHVWCFVFFSVKLCLYIVI